MKVDHFCYNFIQEPMKERSTDIILLKPILIFSFFFHRYLTSCWYSIGYRYRYSKILLTGIFADILTEYFG